MAEEGGASERSAVARILKVTAGMGVSSVVVVLVAMIRTKVVATEVGPGGLGALALLQSLGAVIVLIAGLGLTSSGVLEIAEQNEKGDQKEVDATRWTILALAGMGAVVAGAATYATAPAVAARLGGGTLSASDIRWLSLAVVAGLLGAAALTWINGLRDIRTMAKVAPAAAAIGTLLAVPLLLLGVDPVIAVIVVPAVAQALLTVAMSRGLLRRRGMPDRVTFRRRSRTLLALGSAFVLQGAVAAGMGLLLRSLIADETGVVGLGEFQAAFVIADTYIGFVLGAMAADYLPRLGAIPQDEPALNDAVNVQLRTVLLVSAPLIMLLICAAPLAIHLLYSSSFSASVDMLRVQLLGELARISAWAIGFLLIVRRARTKFVLLEAVHWATFVGLTVIAMPRLGVEGANVAYVVSYVVSIGWLLLLARRENGFAIDRRGWRVLAWCAVGVVATYAAARIGPAGIAVQVVLVGGAFALAFRSLGRDSGFDRLWRVRR